MASSTRKSIPDPVTNRLFALSGNQCAFPNCTNAVTDQVTPGEQPVTLAQRAHIVGVGRQGPRSKAAPLSDNIDSVENLLLLCGEHHRIVDNNPRIYSVEVLAKYKADHEAKMAPKLRPVPPPLETDTVDLSLLPVSDLPSALWRAKSQFRTAAEVGEHLPRSKGEQALPFVLLKSEIWAFHNLADARGPFKQVVDPKTAQQLHAGSVLKSDDRNIYAWLLNGALRQSLIRRGVRFDRAHNRYYFLPDHETITRREQARTKTGRAQSAKKVVRQDGAGTHHGRDDVLSLVVESAAPQLPAIAADWREQATTRPPSNQARSDRAKGSSPTEDNLVFGSLAELAVYRTLRDIQRDTDHQNTFAVLPLPGARLRDASVRTPDCRVDDPLFRGINKTLDPFPSTSQGV